MNAYFSGIPFPALRGQLRGRVQEGTVHILWYLAALALIAPVYLGHFPVAVYAAFQGIIYATSLAAYAFLAMKIYFWDEHSRGELLAITQCLILLILGTAVSKNRCFLSSFLLALSCKGLPFPKICRFFFWFFAAGLVLNLLLVAAGVLEDAVTVRGELWGNGNLRHSLGFGHPNTLGFWGMLLVFSGLLSFYRSRKDFPTVLALLAGSCLLFRLTDSKAAFFSSLLAIFLCLLLRPLSPKLAGKKWVRFGCPAMMLLIVLTFLTLCFLYRPDSGFFRLCNLVLSDRLGYANQGIHSFGFSLFGAQVDFRWDPVDSFYAYAPICLGVVPSLVYFGLHLWSMYRAAKNGCWGIVAVAFAGMLYGTMEYGLMNPIHLPLFAAAAALPGESGRKSSV